MQHLGPSTLFGYLDPLGNTTSRMTFAKQALVWLCALGSCPSIERHIAHTGPAGRSLPPTPYNLGLAVDILEGGAASGFARSSHRISRRSTDKDFSNRRTRLINDFGHKGSFSGLSTDTSNGTLRWKRCLTGYLKVSLAGILVQILLKTTH